MGTIILFDDSRRADLLPLTFTRPIAEIRVGILTITQKWERWLNSKASFFTVDYLQAKYPKRCDEICCLVNGAVLPDENLVRQVLELKLGEALVQGDTLIAGLLGHCPKTPPQIADFTNLIEYSAQLLQIQHLWDIFQLNAVALEHDFDLLTAGRKSQLVSSSNRTVCPERIFIEPGALVEMACLNAFDGPIYIGRDAVVMEGSLIRGPFALCDHSTVKMGAKVYGATTVGPHSKIGGEVCNCVIFGYSNKAHDGFLGNSVIGQWCNLGADTNCSNLKNNYAEVKLWNYRSQHFEKTGLQFCGLIMADHSKCGINTMFNTGTVVGVSSNIFGSGFPRNFIPSFAWGGAAGFERHSLRMAFATASAMMARRGLDFSDIEQDILTHVFNLECAD